MNPFLRIYSIFAGICCKNFFFFKIHWQAILSNVSPFKTTHCRRQMRLTLLLGPISFIPTVNVRFNQLKEQYDLKVHEADLLQERLQQGSHHKQLEDIQALEASIGKSFIFFSRYKFSGFFLNIEWATIKISCKTVTLSPTKILKTNGGFLNNSLESQQNNLACCK